MDRPITGDAMLHGCRSRDGHLASVDYYPCRGTGNVVAVLVDGGRAWHGETGLDWQEKPVSGKTYGTWGGGYGYSPEQDPNSDAAGCIINWPDLEEPSPSPSG